MDRKRAQFILQSFRPDGADASDQDFAEALQLAAEDRELGEWLARERAADAEFARAFSEVEIPDELRMHILTVMRGEKPADPSRDAEMDALLGDALTEVEPPSGLREQILTAMYVEERDLHSEKEPDAERGESPENVSEITERRSKLHVLAWVAAVVLGGFLAFQMEQPTKDKKSLAKGEGQETRFSSIELQRTAGNILNAKFELDVVHPQKSEVKTWLASRRLPVPSTLPRGLRDLKVMGCKKIDLENKESAALLCFVKLDGEMVHMVVIKNTLIKDANLPSMAELTKEDCYHCKKTDWNVVRWRDRENTYFLFEKKPAAEESELIEYF